MEWNISKILALRQSRKGETRDTYVGSPGLIVAFSNLDLIDEYHLMIHPTIVGSGLLLFKNITDRIDLKLLKTKTFGSGAIVLFYETM